MATRLGEEDAPPTLNRALNGVVDAVETLRRTWGHEPLHRVRLAEFMLNRAIGEIRRLSDLQDPRVTAALRALEGIHACVFDSNDGNNVVEARAERMAVCGAKMLRTARGNDAKSKFVSSIESSRLAEAVRWTMLLAVEAGFDVDALAVRMESAKIVHRARDREARLRRWRGRIEVELGDQRTRESGPSTARALSYVLICRLAHVAESRPAPSPSSPARRACLRRRRRPLPGAAPGRKPTDLAASERGGSLRKSQSTGWELELDHRWSSPCAGCVGPQIPLRERSDRFPRASELERSCRSCSTGRLRPSELRREPRARLPRVQAAPAGRFRATSLVTAEADPRTVAKLVAGGRVSPLARQRILRAMRQRGIAVPELDTGGEP